MKLSTGQCIPQYDHIFVDLDGTLVRSDLFIESILCLLARNPLRVFSLLLWLLRGRPAAKEQVARLAKIDISSLPFECELIDYLKTQRRHGKKIVLATAAHRLHAEKVAAHLGFFDEVMASDASVNLKGERKLAAITAKMEGKNFAYAGDGPADRPLWQAAAGNILVNAAKADVHRARSDRKAELVIHTRPPLWRAFRHEMRVHQWAKNLLVFAPLLTAHAYSSGPAILATILAFICFSLCASGVYFLNDLLDLAADRQHSSKRHRPLASGDLPLFWGFIGALLLPATAFLIALLFLPAMFSLTLAAYFIITNAYSFVIKQISTADVMTLSVLYTLRVVAGAAAAGISLSFWLMAFSIFLFVSLAYLKRYIEIDALEQSDSRAHGRGYTANDSETMFTLGSANITAAVLVMAFYINSEDVVLLYRTPEILWLLCLLTLYWGNRVWVGARRGKIDDDPIVFAIRDKVSQMTAVCGLTIVLMARFIAI